MNVIGIDIGLDGGIVLLNDHAEILQKEIMPTIEMKKGKRKNRVFDVQALRVIILRMTAHSPDNCVALEKLHSMPATIPIPGSKPCPACGRKPEKRVQGITSTWTLAEGYGSIRGLLVGLGIERHEIDPRTWQGEMLRDITGKDTKARALIRARQLWPDGDLRKNERCRVWHDGIVDAALIALYQLRR